MKNYFFTFLIGTVLMISCTPEENESLISSSILEKQHLQYDLALSDKMDTYFESLPAPSVSSSNSKVLLGKELYFDNRLSKDQTISCNSCHNVDTYGVDNKQFSVGDNGGLGGRNSPSTFNAALHVSQFWDGRAKNVEEQAGMPVLNPVEMAIPHPEFLIDRLKKVPQYQKQFAQAFPNESQPITYENMQTAIGAFERTLITPAPFDNYLTQNQSALTLQQKKGLSSFINTGCVQCHSGALLGGTTMQKFGVYTNYWEHTKSTPIDDGLFEVTKNESDKYIFKVPSLRNVAKTAPYFHDGSVTSLNKAVDIMAKTQLNKELSKSEIENIVAFLESLTGTVEI